MKKEKLEKLVEKIKDEQIQQLYADNLACDCNITHCLNVTIKYGRKYIKINIGSSGKYMIDEQGNIFGIKAYGVIHKGHWFGSLDTIDDYFWGGYRAYKKGKN